MPNRVLVLAVAATVAGCSYFSNKPPRYEKSSGTSEQTSADLASCRQQANAMIERDDTIDQDIGAARDPVVTGGGSNNLGTNLDGYSREKRYRRIVEECMRQRGYILPEDNSLF